MPSPNWPGYWQFNGVKAAASAGQDIRATPGPGKALVVTKIVATIEVSAAQADSIQDDSGTVVFFNIPASSPVASKFEFESSLGVRLTTNEKFECVGTAGNRIRLYCEGYTQ